MRLADLIPAELDAGLDALDARVEIADLAYDSRAVRPATLFFCIPGAHSDGHDFAAAAVRAGAAALAVERPLGLAVPEVTLPSTRAAMGPIAARFYRDPTATLDVVGVTGTNGKTTTAFLVRALLQAVGRPCGLLGTVTSVVGGHERPVARTTPEAIDLQADFRAMLDGGERACAMEVSSHALALGRTDGTRFAAAVFTNLTQDHLDFHDNMEEYFQAKRRLFVPPAPVEISPAARARVDRGAAVAPRVSVLNIDDPYGRRLAAELPGALTFAIDRDADYRALDVRLGPDGCCLRLHTPAGERSLALPLRGRFNVANALGALAAVHALGGELDVLLAALARGVRVPGRFEPVDEGQDFAVLVDYAHTPDSLESILTAARELIEPPARVLCVFGAGGDRDRGKRPLMGEIAARLADVAIVTSDNPRSEDPDAIIAEILAGAARGRMLGAPPVAALADRRAAIERAVAAARTGDILVVAGKGHEQGQELAGGRKIPFDDVVVARAALRARAAAGAAA
ncbi:MAG TPA: UDP-N-acetylmuramoyl-L-alanyl-D-glutamate--2,6-diaminopimelate ligase [Solirubrobacteraceae bacterium]|jgi:UDP-N-acetylmuramoyl-L-alanyl-D-glutamate--2,6-diaminopimelate ligase|nr:UDP-N-acetylmuramoyl-L-alanyl-D-glutamate--2,6-diaminopimelate ligase [Solirubrobacteraceae bacterium]